MAVNLRQSAFANALTPFSSITVSLGLGTSLLSTLVAWATGATFSSFPGFTLVGSKNTPLGNTLWCFVQQNATAGQTSFTISGSPSSLSSMVVQEFTGMNPFGSVGSPIFASVNGAIASPTTSLVLTTSPALTPRNGDLISAATYSLENDVTGSSGMAVSPAYMHIDQSQGAIYPAFVTAWGAWDGVSSTQVTFTLSGVTYGAFPPNRVDGAAGAVVLPQTTPSRNFTSSFFGS